MEKDDGYSYLKMNMPVPKSPGKTSDDQTTARPRVVHTHPKIDLPFSCAEINDQPSMRNGSTSTDLHGPDEGGGVAGDSHGAGDPPGEDEAPVERHERGDHSKHTHRNLTKRPKVDLRFCHFVLTEAPQIAVFLPNRSDTRPEQKEPSAKPGKKPLQ